MQGLKVLAIIVEQMQELMRNLSKSLEYII